MSEENEYVAFHRERQKPVDAYTHAEIDVMLKKVEAGYDKKLMDLKKEVLDQQKVKVQSLVENWRKQFMDMDEKIHLNVTHESFDIEIKEVKDDLIRLATLYSDLVENHNFVAEVVKKYVGKKRWLR